MTATNQPYAGETCSASRHVLAIAGDLARDGHCQHIVDEPKHCAESMLATVEALWAARNAARATAADHVGDANKMVPGGWPCEIIEADFEHNTVTLKMNHYGYIVGAGPHYLVPADAAPQPVGEAAASVFRMSYSEIQAVLNNPYGLRLLMDYEDQQYIQAESMCGAEEIGQWPTARWTELREKGRQIMSEDLEIWDSDIKAAFGFDKTPQHLPKERRDD